MVLPSRPLKDEFARLLEGVLLQALLALPQLLGNLQGMCWELLHVNSRSCVRFCICDSTDIPIF